MSSLNAQHCLRAYEEGRVRICTRIRIRTRVRRPDAKSINSTAELHVGAICLRQLHVSTAA